MVRYSESFRQRERNQWSRYCRFNNRRMRVLSRSQSTSSARGKLANHSVWRAVESMANELGKKSGADRSKRASLRSLESERDEVR